MTEKTAITKEANRAKKWGFKVNTFNNHKANNPGIKDIPDHIIQNAGQIHWIEVKLPGDTFSDGQKEMAKIISSRSTINKREFYHTIHGLDEMKKLIDNIIAGKYR